MRYLSGLFLGVFLVLSSCGEEEVNEAKKNEVDKDQALEEGWGLHEVGEYSMEYPNDWQLDTSGDMGTEFVLFSPSDGSEDTFKGNNINLMIQPFTDLIQNIDEFVEVSEMQIKASLVAGDIISSERGKLKGNVCHSIVYEGYVGANHLRYEQLYVVIGFEIYILTKSLETSKVEGLSEITDKMIASFTIKK